MVKIPEQLVETIRSANKVLVLTGAGISAESGVPTFREAQSGLWAKYDPQELATPEAFRNNPGLVWDWYVWRRQLISQARPNQGHKALVRLEQLVPDFTLVTQNVDGLHRIAGSTNVVELHGDITRTKCYVEDLVVESWQESDISPPLCPQCGSYLRPDVVWFGESLPIEELSLALNKSKECDLFFSIGTSSVVYPASSLGPEAKRHGATLVEINLDQTPLTPLADFHFPGKAGEILPHLIKAI